jgi:hypothetical protein
LAGDGPARNDPFRRAAGWFLLLAAFAAQYALVRPTNFGGFDEWLFLWLSERGILGSPYSNRPLNFLWTVPGALLPESFLGFHLLHGAYLGLGGLLAGLIARRLLPGRPAAALLCGLATACWAPWDRARLSSVQMTINSGSACTALLATLLLLVGWQRGSRLLLLLAAALALTAARGYEGVLGVLVLAPALLALAGPRDVHWARASAVWAVAVLLAAALTLAPLVGGSAAAAYQTRVLGLDLDAAAVAGRLLRRFVEHLGPLLTTRPAAADGWLPWLSAALALAAAALAQGVARAGAAVAHVSARALGPRAAPAAGARRELVVVALGAAYAAAGYAPFVLSPSLDAPHRAQMHGAFGIGLLLCGLLALAARVVGVRAGAALLALACAGVAWAGAARTAALQRDWDRDRAGPLQFLTLRGLLALAPRLAPHTLVVALDDSQAWRSSFGFRHALLHVYGGEATGSVPGRADLLYRTLATPAGLRTEPLEAIKGPWGVAADSHTHAELLVVRFDARGGVSLVEDWPRELSPFDPGPDYAPRGRLRPGPPAAGARILFP